MGIALLYWGLSCRQVAEFLRFSDSDNASYEAVRQWYHRAQKLLCDPSKRHRPTIAIDRRDEDQGRWREPTWYYSSSGWAAVDTENRELLGVALTLTRDGRDASLPFHRMCAQDVHERTRRRCSWTEDGPWYPKALHRLGVPWVGTDDVREAEYGGAMV